MAQVIETVESLELKMKSFILEDLGFSGGNSLKNHTTMKQPYHKYLLKMPFYRQITIRNAKTFDKNRSNAKN